MTAILTAREFNRDPAAAKRAARKGPVYVTERGQPALVVLDFAEYERLTGKGKSLGELLTPAADLDLDFDFEPGTGGSSARAAEFD